MLSKVRGVCWAVGLVSAAGASRAQAQEAPAASEVAQAPGREAVVLSLNCSLVDYQKQTVKLDKLPGSSVDPDEQKTSTTAYGPLGAGLGFGIGYAWDQVLFGARASLTTADTSLPGGDASATTVSLLPRLEYMFNRETTRPFIAGILGIQHSAASTTQSSFNDDVKVEDSATLFAIGAAFGLHGFLNRSVSLDPEFTLLYASGSGTVKSPNLNDTSPDSRDYSVSAVRVLFSLGLSGWIDTAGAPNPPPLTSVGTEAPSAEPAPPAPVANDEPEVKPVSADIHLPNHRRLYLQVSKDPARSSVLVRLTEQRGDVVLQHCEQVSIFENGGPINLAVRSHGENYLTGRLPLHGLEVLANSSDSSISVCADQWQLSPKSREAVQAFLSARHDLLVKTGEPEGAEGPVTAPAPPPAPAAPADPNVAPPPAPTGAFPAAPEAAPAAPAAPAPDKAAAPPPKAPAPKK